MAGPVVIIAAVLALGGAVAALAVGLRRPASSSASALTPATAMGPLQGAPVNAGPVDPSPGLTRILNRFGAARNMQWNLLQAGLLLRPSELLAIALGSAGLGFLAGVVLHRPLVGLLCAPAGFYLPFMYVSFRRGMRQKALVNQLGDALCMMASSLRSGYSFMRAMQVVRDEMDAPIAEEFGRVLDELNVGVAQERALKHLQDRCPNADVELVVTACQIQASVGGNLAQILDTTSEMIRERSRLQGEIGALTAEGRLSAGILIVLPPVLGVLVSRLSPGYMDALFQTPTGLLLLGGASGAMLAGILVIRKMLDVKI